MYSVQEKKISSVVHFTYSTNITEERKQWILTREMLVKALRNSQSRNILIFKCKIVFTKKNHKKHFISTGYCSTHILGAFVLKC